MSFDGFKAVNDLSFYVDEREIRVIIGPNGAGKTTVLDLICGKTRATSGSIKFRNKELTRLRENEIVEAGVGRKFQTPSIYDDLTVFENLEISYPKGRTVFGALSFRRDARVRDRVQEIAETIFLADKLQTQAEYLSHGQKLGHRDRARHEVRRGHRPQGHGAPSGADPRGRADGGREEQSQGRRSLPRPLRSIRC